MFKKRERAKKGISSSRQPSVQKPVNDSPKSPTQISSARVSDVKKLSVSDLQERYAERDVDQARLTQDQLGPIDDVWEDEQLRKLGINLNRPPTIRDAGDPFGEVRSRIEERLSRLKGELELSRETKENT